jgi:hypothetical protein
MVTEGTTYADTQWKLTTNNPIVIGVTALVFEQNSAFAFGNVYANGTAVLATGVGDVLTLTAGNNIQITGNNASKSVTIGVTGISLTSIANGTSNVNVASSGGNVTVGVGGTGNVAVFSTSGLDLTGRVSATGNITGGNILGNGRGLSGINTFSSLAVTGSNTLTANSITTALTFTGDPSIVITANTTTNVVSFAFGGTGDSIFATGGDMGLITEAPTSEENFGLVTEAVTESYDLAGFFLDGLVGNDNFLLNSINGNILTANTVITSPILTTPTVTSLYGQNTNLVTTPYSDAGLIPGELFYRLNSTFLGTAGTSAQPFLGVGVTLSASTVYQFEAVLAVSKSATASLHNFQLGFGGTATLNNIAYEYYQTQSSVTSFNDTTNGAIYGGFIQTASATTVAATSLAAVYKLFLIKGTVSVNAEGTFIPQYTTSVSVGPYTTAIGSYFKLSPLGASGANTSIGTWA